jgi:hypothetical protein
LTPLFSPEHPQNLYAARRFRLAGIFLPVLPLFPKGLPLHPD